ncbi:acetyl-CoA carboxylase biotin carboxylase subunit [Amycolatopsis saalfeldensis]|uniref:biotin carboxylase n=1 Tax=Amycolatopsis saalfeldensis TaxID=394193 RepID=A0A1H8XD92_9PSEU|nr:biotin carboxylase N-terminal domain-containing protein [Amycolatopsis saalfeldensis]SEP37761.1 acetyl-CoA carboxylase, biotin carboxylase subunit [Amycolatopsis saalfeldensis]
MNQPFPRRLLVANRGEIARRVIRTARRLGVETVAVHHSVDAGLPYVTEAGEAREITGEPPVAAYLDIGQIIAVAKETSADAVHPGYGFLAENAGFARAVEAAGLTWVGPSPEAITAMGDKVEARNRVAAAGVPVSGGAGSVPADADEAVRQAEQLGYPVMVKASGGGGGIGMTIARDAESVRKEFERTQAIAARSFGSDRVFLERFVESARHIEVQVLGLADGTVLTLGERDCSVQRRNQKLVEEAPAPGLDPAVRQRLLDAAAGAARAVGYRNAGTVEFLVDARTQEFVFLEMNTRIQVEHPVTELVHGVDLVEQQLSIAVTGSVTRGFAPRQHGHALEFRLCAEDPVRFFPSPGPIERWEEPHGDGIRVDAGYRAGLAVTPHFDSLMAKICVHGVDREAAIERAREALDAFSVGPLRTNLPFLRGLLDRTEFTGGGYDTGIVAAVTSRAAASTRR